ncbi:uncharacterized protein LOC131941971 [Physella acuta]|uniref:uncharacterized protein LOC131941971 n=1 Tax=Physella acuta TaxID=109671 RepID=UPI0027DC0552|nr:uncharacterized protein LOC131941971 [Physella acuta]
MSLMRFLTFAFLALLTLTHYGVNGNAMDREIQAMIDMLRADILGITKKLMAQQLYAEEKTRTDGGSGIKQIRVDVQGSETFYANSHTGTNIAGMHDQYLKRNVMAFRPAQYVLNGVEFRTNTTYFSLMMPISTKLPYKGLREILFPPVPPEVLNKETVHEQIHEMREWFKAWKTQDFSTRDYRRYFKPVLCYLEGMWEASKSKDEFETWFQDLEKIRFYTYTGLYYDLMYLPTTITSINKETGMPVFARFNYRVVCHPLTVDVPTSYLKYVNELQVRIPRSYTIEEAEAQYNARFTVTDPEDYDFNLWSTLETLMEEIPGLDNYGVNITDTSFDETLYSASHREANLLNVGYYHRRYRPSVTDTATHRCFSDPTVFVAETTSEEVAPITFSICKEENCTEIVKRVSYAVPLSIVYLTPLSLWNPYNIGAGDEHDSRNNRYKVSSTDSTDDNYARTPVEFFSGGNPADYPDPVIVALDSSEHVRNVTASGIRMILPNISGVGKLRTVYPIVPVHYESSSVGKEMSALKTVVMQMYSYSNLLLQHP